jgi:hypothetical protein
VSPNTSAALQMTTTCRTGDLYVRASLSYRVAGDCHCMSVLKLRSTTLRRF